MNERDLFEDGRIVVPVGVMPAGVSHLGRNLETGGQVVAHHFTFHDKATGKRQRVRILADRFTSQAQIEDMAASSLERWMLSLREEAQRKTGKHTPSPEERREVGAALREFRSYAAKRRESSNGKLYYLGVH